MRALKASIQPAATKVTNMLYLSKEGVSFAYCTLFQTCSSFRWQRMVKRPDGTWETEAELFAVRR